jgi:hypothetical protein
VTLYPATQGVSDATRRNNRRDLSSREGGKALTQAESKSDRPSFTPEKRAEWVSRYRSSGQTQAHFAQQHGLELTTLQWWIYGSQRKQQHSTAAFREIAVSLPWSGGVWAAEVTGPSGMTVCLGARAEASWIEALLKAVRPGC